MATFPTLEQSGTAYLIQLWGSGTGGIPVVVGCPSSPDIATPEVEALLRQFADGLALQLDAPVTSITRYATGSTDISLPPV